MPARGAAPRSPQLAGGAPSACAPGAGGTPRQRRGRRAARLLLLALFLLALGLRLWGVGFGLPYHYHPDERGHVLEAALMAQARTIRPSTFSWPPLYAYVLMAEYGATLAAGLAVGHYASVADFSRRMTLDPSLLYLLGRVTSAVAGALAVPVSYAIGRAAFNRRAGLLAAAFLAVAFLPVRDSHFAVNDALLTLLTGLSLLGSALVVRRGQARDYLLAGGAAGLATATKYTAAFALAALVVAHLLAGGFSIRRPATWKLRRLAAGLAAFAVSAVLGCPYFLLAPGQVLRDIGSGTAAYGRKGFEGWQIDAAGGYAYYLKSVGWGLGAGLSLLCLLGVAWAVVRRQRAGLVLLTFPLLLYLFMGQQKMYFARFLLPAIPALLLLAAAAIDQVATAAGRRGPARLVLLLALVAAAQPLAWSLRFGWLLSQTDTRTLAKQWIEANIPQGASIAVDWPHHGPPLSTEADPMPASSRTYQVWLVGGHGLSDHSLEEYRARGVDYLVASSFISQLAVEDRAEDARRRAFYLGLEGQADLLQRVDPGRDGAWPPFIFDEIYGPAVSLWQRQRPGPVLLIYRLRQAGAVADGLTGQGALRSQGMGVLAGEPRPW